MPFVSSAAVMFSKPSLTCPSNGATRLMSAPWAFRQNHNTMHAGQSLRNALLIANRRRAKPSFRNWDGPRIGAPVRHEVRPRMRHSATTKELPRPVVQRKACLTADVSYLLIRPLLTGESL